MANVGRKAYPIVISKEDDGFYYVEIPDFDIATQGESVPDAIAESAKIDGAGQFTIFWKVVLPVLKPGLFNSTTALKDLVIGATISIADLPTQSVKMAMAVVVTGPVLLFYPFVQKYFVSGITIGAVKG